MRFAKICVIAANNSQTTDGKMIDYIQLANVAASRVKLHLNIPVFLVTSNAGLQASSISNFDSSFTIITSVKSQRRMIAGEESIQYEWYNDMRVDVYDIFRHVAEKILMIDADYMIASDLLKPWLESDAPFQIFDKTVDVTGRDLYNSVYFPSNDIIQRWATAICWTPCDEAKVIFDTARMVRENYEFYSLMLGMPAIPYRNDVAFSVACHLHNVPLSPQRLFHLPQDSYLFAKSSYPETWMIRNGHLVNLWSGDLHILNKSYAIDPALLEELKIKND